MTATFTALSDVFDRRANYPQLDAADEPGVIAAAVAGDEGATAALLRAYAKAIRNAVSGYRNAGGANGHGGGLSSADAQAEDLRAAALLGFVEALRAFDPGKHARLAAVLPQHLRAELSAALGVPFGLSVPKGTLKRFFSIMAEAGGDVVAAAELAPRRSMTAETFRSILDAVRAGGSLDGSDDEDGTAPDVAADRLEWSDPEAVTESDAALVRMAFAAVDDEEGRVCRISYGFEDYDPQPDAEVAHRMGLTRSKVQRVRNRALGRMREALTAA